MPAGATLPRELPPGGGLTASISLLVQNGLNDIDGLRLWPQTNLIRWSFTLVVSLSGVLALLPSRARGSGSLGIRVNCPFLAWLAAVDIVPGSTGQRCSFECAERLGRRLREASACGRAKDSQEKVSVELRVLKVLAHLRAEHVDFFLPPAKHARKDGHEEALEPLGCLEIVPRANRFLTRTTVESVHGTTQRTVQVPLTSFWSAGQMPKGMIMVVECTSSKPASVAHFSRNLPGFGSRPALSHAWMKMLLTFSPAVPASELSGARHFRSTSTNSA